MARIAHLYRNVFPLEYAHGRKEKWTEDIEARLEFAIQIGREMGLVKSGSSVIFVCGWQPGAATTNSMRILQVEDDALIGSQNKEYTFQKTE